LRTREREVAVLVVALTLVAGLSGCFLPTPPYVPPKPAASFEITNWTQSYSEYSHSYSDYVYVYYKVTNTGTVDIDYYEVWIEVHCTDGSTFQDWTNGLNVARGVYLTDWTMINTAGKQAASVSVTRYELKSY
jgi:uncharacterized membrane protein